MIGKLTGHISFIGSNYVILDVSGVGYKVFAPLETIRTLSKQEEVISVFTHLAVRENALDMYGFLTQSELDFFEMLITVSGIGPKSAVGILSVAPIDTLKSAVASGDTSYLTKVSGIGKRNAEKIVLELRDKLGALEYTQEETTLHKEESEAVAALEALGYPTKDAREAIKATSDAQTTEEKIRAALKNLGGA